MKTGEILRVSNLKKSFGEVRALNAVSLSVQAGQLIGLIGSDGAGKTTLIRIVAGLLRADSGEVTYRAEGAGNYTGNKRGRRPAIGYLAQGFALYSDLTVRETMRFFSELHGLRRYEERSSELLEMVGLAPFGQRRAGRLSGGMKKKLALACALVHGPELLLLDEPTTGVDPVSRREFWGILARLQDDGLAVLLSTPYFDEAERCTEVVLMHAGEVLNRGTPEAVAGSLGGVILEVLCNPVRSARSVLAGTPGVDDIQLYGDRLHVNSRTIGVGELQETIRSCLGTAGIRCRAIREVHPGIEDVFIARMQEAV